MRMATFNIENLDLPVEARLPVLRPALERLEADIVCLQEVNGQRGPGERARSLKALDRLLEGTRYETYHRAATERVIGEGPAEVHNLVTLSRYPVLSHAQIQHDLMPALERRVLTAEPPSESVSPVRFERPVLHAVIDLGPARLHVVNVHFRAPIASPVPGQKQSPFVWRTVMGWAEGYYVSGLKRIGQALELRLLVDRIFDAEPEALVLIAGDFNCELNETPLRLLAGSPEDTGNMALASRSLVVLDRALDTSRRFSAIHMGQPQMLDHILASHALFGEFRSIEVHNEALGDAAIAYGKGLEAAGSYHAAVVASFSF
jgi:endonuclease/exonuclease/phosphatase family metal-dependent hydrolase